MSSDIMEQIFSLTVISLMTFYVNCDSFNLIAGYEPESNVMEHLRLDLDQKDFEDFLKVGNFSAASDIYINGGNSKKSMKINIYAPLSKEYIKGSKVEQGAAKGKLITNVEKGDTTLKVSVTSACFGKFSKMKDSSGCFSETGEALKIDGEEVAIGINVNLPFRTLAGFSVAAESKMKGQQMFEMYKDYYGAPDYADKFIKAALKGQDETKRVNIPFTFAGKEDIFRIECAKKGSAYWSVWMYVIREMEDAINDCKSGCELCNDAPVHAWDEAVAFYTGSIEGKDGDAGGKMLYRLAEKRCKNFRTCQGGISKVNKEIIRKFTDGKRKLDQGKCDEIQEIKERIIKLMTIPLIQGTLRYAYKTARGDNTPKEKAEGVAFLGAVIPQLYQCSHEDADIVKKRMWIDGDIRATKDGFESVKKAFQRNYECLGLRCDDIGGHLDDLEDAYHPGFRPCTDGVSSTPNGGQSNRSPVGLLFTVLIGFVKLYL